MNLKSISAKKKRYSKKPDMKIRPIKIDHIKMSSEEIIKKADEFQKKKYSGELVNKKIIILQNLEKYGDVWNITLITRSFNTLNIKLNADDGGIVYHNLESMMNFIKK